MSQNSVDSGKFYDYGSFKIGSFLGVPLRINIFLILYCLLIYFFDKNLSNIIFYLMAILSIIPHEYGHTYAAIKRGFSIKNVTIYFYGGLAALEDEIEGVDELVIGAAGPAVSLVIVVLCLLIGIMLTGKIIPADHSLANAALWPWWFKLGIMNGLILALNMMPAWPMDGGRILRSITHICLGKTAASVISRIMGVIFGILFILYAWHAQNVMMGIIGVIVALIAFRPKDI